MEQQKYSFHYLPIKDLYRFLGIFIGGIIMLPIVGFVLEAYNLVQAAEPFLIAYLVIWFVGVGYYMVKLFKKHPEEILFTDQGFRSRLFGEIRYKEVISYRVSTGLSRLLARDKPASSLHITLRGGQKIRFDLHPKYYAKKIDAFMAFTNRFVDDMGALVFEKADERSEGYRRIPGESEAESVKSNLRDAHREAKAGLAKIRERRRNRTKFDLLFKLGFSAMILLILLILLILYILLS